MDITNFTGLSGRVFIDPRDKTISVYYRELDGVKHRIDIAYTDLDNVVATEASRVSNKPL